MQYGVPQFIDIEDKIIGPLTGKQVVYLIVGGGILLLISTFFDLIIFVFSFIIIAPLTLGFAFYKPKGVTVAKFIMITLNFYSSSHLYVWRREPETRMFKPTQKKSASREEAKKEVAKSSIRELAWLLDTSTAVNMPYETRKRPEEATF